MKSPPQDSEKLLETLLIDVAKFLPQLVSSIDFLKSCSTFELKLVFYNLWNVVIELKEHDLT